MPSFFNLAPAARGRVSKNILILLNSAQSFPRRSYSAMSPLSSRIDWQREEALEKHGLSNLKLVWPKKVVHAEDVDYKNKNPQSVGQMYSGADLSKLPIFQGGFINFGYWPNPFFDDRKITIAERIACSKEMYRVMGDLLGILQNQNILEVGCGLGYGSAFLSQEYKPKLVVGLDISPEQIARAKKYQVSGILDGKLRFALGEAESLPFLDNSFDYIVSVEAAQHFESIDLFSKEASRILKPDGKFVMTSFFPKSKEGVRALNAIVPDYHIHGSQSTVDEVKEKISAHMGNVKITSIGENVWHGFSKWLDQIGYESQWSKIWPALYKKDLVDYVIYQADAPKAGVFRAHSK
jgi:MPBQ/MSBQ methyltransferase